MAEVHAVALSGCAPEPLMGYLKALAVLRLVALGPDSAARGFWQGERFCLAARLTEAELMRFFLDEYCPTPILSPWNGGSGFWDRLAAGRALQRLRESTNPRLEPYRTAVARTDAVLEKLEMRARPKDAEKLRLLRTLRSRLPDAALPWLDAAAVLTAVAPRFAPILGSGGNDGNLDFSANYVQHLERVIPFSPTPDGTRRRSRSFDQARSEAWLADALFGSGRPPLADATAGQYHPGAVSAPNATRGMEGKGLVNPWDFILLIEGALLFAGAVVRRLGGGARASFPFTVDTSLAGSGTFARGEAAKARGELWVPIWDQPATYAALEHLLAEGRAQAGRRQARTGVDFARAVAGLGVDRGIQSFCRYGLLCRNGRAYLAAPLGRLRVRSRTHVHLLDELDPWLEAWRRWCRSDETPERFRRALRGMEAAIYVYCAEGSPRALQAVLASVGRAERALAGSAAEEHLPWPMQDLSPDWLAACDDGRPEYRLAASLASVSDPVIGPLRTCLEPVEERQGRFRWVSAGPRAVWSVGSLPRSLAAVLDRRLLDARRAGSGAVANAGSYPAALADVQAFLEGGLDEEAMADLIWGLATLRWPRSGALSRRPGPAAGAPPELNRAYALLKLVFWPGPLRLGTGAPEATVPRDPAILWQVRAGHMAGALAAANRRLWARELAPLGWTGGSKQPPAYKAPAGGAGRLAGALLFPLASPRPLAELVLRPNAMAEKGAGVR